DREHIFLQLPAAIDLYWRNEEALLKYLSRVSRQRPGHLSAYVSHVSEHGRPGDESPLAVNRHEHQPVVRVTDSSVYRVRIIREEYVAFLDSTGVTLHETPDERAKLADDHLAVQIGDHRKFV